MRSSGNDIIMSGMSWGEFWFCGQTLWFDPEFTNGITSGTALLVFLMAVPALLVLTEVP